MKDLRLARGLTQEALATWMAAAEYPMHQTTAAKIESGVRPTSVGEVAALATLFNVPIGSFFDTTNEVVTIHMELARKASIVAFPGQGIGRTRRAGGPAEGRARCCPARTR